MATATAYADALEFLFPRVTTIKFGLDTTRTLLSAVGDPHLMIPAVHVGGTNGKGSVASLVASALGEMGWKVGLYTSPHVVSFRERIRVAGIPISEEAVAMWTARLRPLIEAHGATFFEATTAMAFADFASRGAEVAVIEVGLGGRLDSTNVLQPLVSVVTKIEVDHVRYLGDTLELIAGEKAGIAKPGAPFVIGEARPEIVAVLCREGQRYVSALERGAVLDARPVPPDAEWKGPLRLEGPHQRRNAAVALAALDALPATWRPEAAAVERGFAEAFIAGRLDRRGRYLFDVAHNPDGVRTLVAALDAQRPPGPVHALVAILGDKDWPEMLRSLDGTVERGVLTVAPTAAGRGWNLEALERWLRDRSAGAGRVQWAIEPDLGRAVERAQEGAGTILVTGSFHTVGDVMHLLGLDP
ncbi:MAG: folC [Gemmatimonadetes bacterium]|nr:folC [Gemmatimonadota bacterium]